MSKLTAYGKIFRAWEAVLAACEGNAALLPGVDELKTEVTSLLEQGRTTKAQQEIHAGDRVAATERLRKIVDDGNEAVRKLRAFVKSRVGSRTDILKQFGIAPIRKRLKPVDPPAAPEVTPSTPGTPSTGTPHPDAPHPPAAAATAEAKG